MKQKHLKIGHYTDKSGGTGLTVIIPDQPAPCSWWLCGSSPATRDVNLLNADANIERIDALVFSGGSAYGLGATNGVMRWLQEQNRGYHTTFGVVPIVPTAGIFDLHVNGLTVPTAENAYQACQQATSNHIETGRIGVGTGAAVGKWLPTGNCMSGGFGFFEITGPNGLVVSAAVAANSVGNIQDEQGKTVAGAVLAKGGFASIIDDMLSASFQAGLGSDHQNTTLVAIITNGILNKTQLSRISKMASAGIARATQPAFSRFDGDVVFSMSLGKVNADEVIVGTLAAIATHQAILNAVANSVIIN